MRRALATGLLLAALAAGAQSPPEIRVENEAGVAPAALDSILADFGAWGARVYAHHGATPGVVRLRLTRSVPFGFYRNGTVLLPPSPDRGAMLEDWIHELTHHVLGRDSSFFFREGAATHTVEALFAQDGRVPQGWPYFGRACDAWVQLFVRREQLPPLEAMLTWPRYRGETPEQDFRSWQIYLAGGSFVAWYRQRHGSAGFRAAFAERRPAADAGTAQAQWLAAVAARRLPDFEAAAVLPARPRYQAYAGYLGARDERRP